MSASSPAAAERSRPCLSVLMPCRNAGQFQEEAIASVLADPAVLELLIADGGSTDGSLALLRARAATDRRLRLVSYADDGPADALNRASAHARGTLVGWLNADDRYLPGAASRAVAALESHPDWLMVYGEGEHIDASGTVLDRYPSRPPSAGLEGFRDYCYICQPSVFWRRSLQVLLGPFDTTLRTCFDFDYWLRAFAAFPERIGQISSVQAQTRRHDDTISATQLPRAVLEATVLQGRTFRDANHHLLRHYLAELIDASQPLPASCTLAEHREQLLAMLLELPISAEQLASITAVVQSAYPPDARSGSGPRHPARGPHLSDS